MHQAMKIPDAQAAVDEKWEKLEKLPAWQMTKSKEQKGGHPGGTKKSKEQYMLRR